MLNIHHVRRTPLMAGAFVLLFALTLLPARTESSLSPQLRTKVDDIAKQVLKTTGVPSASVAIVQDGKIAYVQAYGAAKLDPHTPATPEMRYSIGSISKQFTAAAILLLAEEGKLSLDDPVSKYVPGLTAATKSPSARCCRTPRAIRISGRRIMFRR